jgi:transcriptional regulator with XRE-family HTH domain
MSGVDLVSNLRAALKRRNMTLEAIANMCSSSPNEVRAILRGCASNPNAQDIQIIASTLAAARNDPTERSRFLCEVFEIIPQALGSTPPISPQQTERRVIFLDRAPLIKPRAIWFDSLGAATEHSNPNLTALAYEILKVQPGRENIVGFACSNLGYVGLSLEASGTLRIYYDYNIAARQPLTAAYEWMREHAQQFRRVVRTQMNRLRRDGADNLEVLRYENSTYPSESPNEAAASLERLVASAAPLIPRDWLVDRRSIDEAPAYLRDSLRLSAEGSSLLTALAAENRLRAAHIYTFVDNGLVCIQGSSTVPLPTPQYVGTPVLARPTERDYATIVDKHLTEAFRENSPTLYRLGITMAGRKVNYWRLAMPDKDSGIVVSLPWEIVDKKPEAASL